jgi:hypothetical protein
METVPIPNRMHKSRYTKHGRGFEIIGLYRYIVLFRGVPAIHVVQPCRRNHATTKATICKDCEKLKKRIDFWRDLAGRYKASIDALYGRLREARVARADRTKPVHNSRILTKRLLADAARARKNPRGRARAGSGSI